MPRAHTVIVAAIISTCIECLQCSCLQCFDAVGWAAGRAFRLYKTECWGAGVVLSGARCRLAYGPAVATSLTVSCFSKIKTGFTFLVLADQVVSEKGPLNGCVYVYSRYSANLSPCRHAMYNTTIHKLRTATFVAAWY